MALGFRFTAERLYQLGYINRLVEKEELMPTAISMAERLLTLIPASRVNTLYMMKQLAPKIPQNFKDLADELHNHGYKEDRMESNSPQRFHPSMKARVL